MTTKFYFPSVGDASIKVDYDPFWNYTSSLTKRLELSTVPTGSELQPFTTQEPTGANSDGRNLLVCQYISLPLKGQYIMGTFKGMFQASASGDCTKFFSQVIIKIVSPDGKVVRGVLYPGDRQDNPNLISLSDQWLKPRASRFFPRSAIVPAALSSVQTLDGDRLVIELGYRSLRTAFIAQYGTIYLGDNGIGDLPFDQTNTAEDLNPHGLFSHTFEFV